MGRPSGSDTPRRDWAANGTQRLKAASVERGREGRREIGKVTAGEQIVSSSWAFTARSVPPLDGAENAIKAAERDGDTPVTLTLIRLMNRRWLAGDLALLPRDDLAVVVVELAVVLLRDLQDDVVDPMEALMSVQVEEGGSLRLERRTRDVRKLDGFLGRKLALALVPVERSRSEATHSRHSWTSGLACPVSEHKSVPRSQCMEMLKE